MTMTHVSQLFLFFFCRKSPSLSLLNYSAYKPEPTQSEQKAVYSAYIDVSGLKIIRARHIDCTWKKKVVNHCMLGKARCTPCTAKKTRGIRKDLSKKYKRHLPNCRVSACRRMSLLTGFDGTARWWVLFFHHLVTDTRLPF